jgi:ankyrin repeat protein
VRIISLLIEHGATVNIADHKGMHALHYAAWQGYMDPVGLLLHGGAVIGVHSGDTKDTPLHLACQHGHYDVVSILVQNKAGLLQGCQSELRQNNSRSNVDNNWQSFLNGFS